MRLVILVLFVLIAAVDCIIIDCLFEDQIYNSWNKRYTCKTRKFNIKDDAKVVKVVLGEHGKNKTDDDITQYFAKGVKIEQANMRKGKS
jgi:hypothetical protein